MGVPLKDAIESGGWYECVGRCFDEEHRFRLRVLDFVETTVDEIDDSLAVEVEGVLWLMSVEIISLCKEPCSADHVADTIALMDSEGFRFDRFDGGNLSHNRPSGLFRFSGWSDNHPLTPKVVAAGSLAFVLPPQECNYQIVIRDGQIRGI